MAGIATPTSRCFHSPAGLSIPAVLLHLMFSLTDVVHCGKLLIIFFSTFLSLYLLSLQSFIFLTNSTSGMESLNGLLFLVLLEDTQFQESLSMTNLLQTFVNELNLLHQCLSHVTQVSSGKRYLAFQSVLG